ncbi:DUF4430 domain-containing protein [Gaiella sp.]|uniref:DUF4430 domain-containing protein n=1 Tax=Gaiella sp. TaxID=2663207 RepID=UPI003262D127
MTRRLCIGLLLAVLANAGCGGEGPTAADGKARLWVTRDRGAIVLVDLEVPAGQSLLRALKSKAKVTTRYGGGFVQSIDGIEGSARRHEDWFWFVNGLAGDRSASSYRLRDGDVAWWDYRDWSRDAETLEVVAGAFPEPFLHGYAGRTRPAAVRYAPGLAVEASRVARVLGSDDVAARGSPVDADANVFEFVDEAPHLTAVLRQPGSGPSGAVRFSFSGSVVRLLDGDFSQRFESP